MDIFHARNGQLHVEGVPADEIAQEFGTPCYVYSRAAIEQAWRSFDEAFLDYPHLVCYAVKANSNLAVLNLLARLGSGFDIVSVGELERVLRAGGAPHNIVFSGVGKRADEMERALKVGVRCFNVESEAELERLNQVAGTMKVRAPVALRVNPDVNAETHPYISTGLHENKFGIAMEDALALYQKAAAMAHIQVRGISCHIGSQLTRLDPILDALDRLFVLIDALGGVGIEIRHIDIGGGLGIRYRDETTPAPGEYASALLKKFAGRSRVEVIIEPGRAIAGNSGLLLTRVEYLKRVGDKRFAIVDAAMNDLMRPALYDAWHDIEPVTTRTGEGQYCDIVGPVCESGDFLGKQRNLNVLAGDLLAIRSAGAYGFSMSSNYNSRPRAAEVMVDGNKTYLVRRREDLVQLMVDEATLPV